jgi:quercetin dioxygenase-like cupin family protein
MRFDRHPEKGALPMTVATAGCYRWDDLEIDRPMDKIERRRIIGEHAMLSEILLHAGCVVPTHAHPNEQFACVMSGQVRFGIGAEDDPDRRTVVMGAGEGFHVPPNVPHSAEAIEESRVLDVFSPTSERTGVDAHG